MRVTPINNNYQKQPSFGAIPGEHFAEGLTGFLTEFFGSKKKAAKILTTKNCLKFVTEMRAIKLKSVNLGEIDPVIDLIPSTSDFYIKATLSGIGSQIYRGKFIYPNDIPAKSNPLNFIIDWAKNVAEEFQENYMPSIGIPRENASIKETAHTLTDRIYQTVK